MTRKPILALAIAAAINPAVSFALGVGDIHLHSGLNQELKAEIALHAVEEGEVDGMKVRLAPPMAFAKAGLDRPFYLTDLRFTPKKRADGQAVIEVTSHNPIRESYVNFLLDINWSKGRLMREYTLLLDPPTTFRHRAPAINRPVASAAPAAHISAVADMAKVKLSPTSTEYRVKRNDNLWHIAKKHLPKGVSQEEMMAAIYRANPHAFGGHIDILKTGQVLRIPGMGSASSVTDAEKRAEILANAPTRQDTTPDESEKKISGEGKTTAESESAEAAPEIKPEATQSQITGDRVEIVSADEKSVASQTENAESAELGRLKKELLLAQEEVAKFSAENEDLRSDVTALKSQLTDSTRLLELTNNKIALLQEQVANQQAKEQGKPPVAEPPPTEPEQVEPPVAEQLPAEPEQVEPPVAEQPPAEPEQVEPPVAETPAAEQKPPITAVETKVSAPPADLVSPEPKEVEQTPPQEGSGLLSNPMVWGGGVLALLAGLLLMRRGGGKSSSKKSGGRISSMPSMPDDVVDEEYSAYPEEDDDEDVVPPEEHTLLFEENVTRPDFPVAQEDDGDHNNDGAESSLLMDFTPSELKDMGGHTAVDPLSEVDVYVAYGRYHQAQELLSNAIDNDPGRLDLKLKMLEILHAGGTKGEFVKLAEQYAAQGIPDTNPDEWSKVVAFGQELAPNHPLFAKEGAVSENEDSFGPLSEPLADPSGMDSNVAQAEASLAQMAAELGLNSDTEMSEDHTSTLEGLDELADLDVGDGKDDQMPEQVDMTSLGLTTEPHTIEESLAVSEDASEDSTDSSALSALDGLSGLTLDTEDLSDDLSGSTMPSVPTVIQNMDTHLDTMDGLSELDLDLDSEISAALPASVIGDLESELDTMAQEDELPPLGRDREEEDDGAPIFTAHDEDTLANIEALSGIFEDSADLPSSSLTEDAGEQSLEDLEASLSAYTNELDAMTSDLSVIEESGDSATLGDLSELELSAQEMSELNAPSTPADASDMPVDSDDHSVVDRAMLDEVNELSTDLDDESQTKIELAEAYIEMGDPEGAKDILKEVQKEGNDEQKDIAQKMLDSLS